MKEGILKQKKGYTAVELLIVVSILIFIVTLITVSITGMRQKSRDATRLNHINTIRKGFDLYLTATSKGYPASIGECLSNSSPTGVTLISADAVKNIPTDPLWPSAIPNDTGGFCYYYISDDYDVYTLDYFLETAKHTDKSGPHQASNENLY